MPIHVLSWDGQSISGSRDTLTRKGVAVPIHVLSWDGQSISGSRDTLTGGCSVLMPIHVLSRDGQRISGSWDTLTPKIYRKPLSLGHLTIRDKILLPNGVHYKGAPLYFPIEGYQHLGKSIIFGEPSDDRRRYVKQHRQPS